MPHSRPLRRFWSLTALVVMLQLIVVQAMAASASLHECCHNHSDEPEHQCAVTLMLHGGYAHILPDIVPETARPEPPQVPPALSAVMDAEPASGGARLLADAAPRGP